MHIYPLLSHMDSIFDSTHQTGDKQGVTVAIKKKLKRRSAVEPVIGHMKNDGVLGRNFLKGAAQAMP